jgi:hypothetical protein
VSVTADVAQPRQSTSICRWLDTDRQAPENARRPPLASSKAVLHTGARFCGNGECGCYQNPGMRTSCNGNRFHSNDHIPRVGSYRRLFSAQQPKLRHAGLERQTEAREQVTCLARCPLFWANCRTARVANRVLGNSIAELSGFFIIPKAQPAVTLLTFGLITQRSLVQIQPPQPRKS